MKNVSLIFPPFTPTASNSPYLSVPLLATILENAGHSVKRFDFNYQMNRDLLDIELYEELLTQVESEELREIYTNAISYLKDHKDDDYIEHWVWNVLQTDVSLRVIELPKNLEDYFTIGMTCHLKVETLINQYVEELLATNSDTLAFSVAFGEQLLYTLEMIKRLKAKSPDTVVFLGGAQISLLTKEQVKSIKSQSSVDLIFQGYGEDDIVNVIKKFGVSREPMVITGGTSTSNSMQGLPKVQFDWDLDYNQSKTYYPVLVTKGCYWGKCKFCDYVLMGDLGNKRFIQRPVEEVYEEIKAIRKIKPDCIIDLISDAVPPAFYLKLAKLANAENFKLRTRSYMINNKSLTDEFFSELSKAEVYYFTFGTESVSDRVLALMSKQANQETIINNFEMAKKYNLKFKVNLIPNYPTTTFEEAKKAIKILYLYKENIVHISTFKFYLSANTEMFNNPKDFNLEIDRSPYYKSDSNGFHSAKFKSEESMTPEQEDYIYQTLHELHHWCLTNNYPDEALEVNARTTGS